MANEDRGDANTAAAAAIVEELVRCGVDLFCLSPGQRSTPLAAAAARQPGARCVVHFDERGAAFHALGWARAAGRPAALICTSGTAAAEYFPAVVEASMDRVPMVVLTADRPPELRSAGANQAIDQVRLYGGHVRWSFDLPVPEPGAPLRAVRTTVDHAVFRARSVPAGPVHLNCMFREPLEPRFGRSVDPAGAPVTAWERGAVACPEAAVDAVARELAPVREGVVVAGRGARSGESALRVAERLGWPAIADLGSGLRLGPRSPGVAYHHDLILASGPASAALRPRAVLHLGGGLVSKRFLEWIGGATRPSAYALVAEHPERDDPAHAATRRLACPDDGFCEALLRRLEPSRDPSWRAAWDAASRSVSRIIEGAVDADGPITQPWVAREVVRSAPAGSWLFVGNSLPVREVDAYAPPDGPPLRVALNRGASGIDGSIATAAGVARGAAAPTIALVGDLALLHDLNSLAMLRDHEQPVTVVVVNNDGGGIFSLLGIARDRDIFERFWGTPHGLGFEHAAALFSLRYARPSSRRELVEACAGAARARGGTLVEVRTDRAENAAFVRTIEDRVRRELEAP